MKAKYLRITFTSIPEYWVSSYIFQSFFPESTHVALKDLENKFLDLMGWGILMTEIVGTRAEIDDLMNFLKKTQLSGYTRYEVEELGEYHPFSVLFGKNLRVRPHADGALFQLANQVSRPTTPVYQVRTRDSVKR